MQAEDQGLSVQLKVPGAVDFAGDGRPTRGSVETLRLAASFKLLTVPKLLPYAFRAAEAQNTARYPWCRVAWTSSRAAASSASTRLPLVPRGDRIKLAFGIDEQIKVKRSSSRSSRRTRLPRQHAPADLRLPGGAAVLRPQGHEVTLQVQVPVSQMDDVEVLVEPKATTPGYELAKDDGFLTWKVGLAPKEKRTVELRFAVEIPAKYDSSSL
jgi:uncharacterized protein (TIGR02231 family)